MIRFYETNNLFACVIRFVFKNFMRQVAILKVFIWQQKFALGSMVLISIEFNLGYLEFEGIICLLSIFLFFVFIIIRHQTFKGLLLFFIEN